MAKATIKPPAPVEPDVTLELTGEEASQLATLLRTRVAIGSWENFPGLQEIGIALKKAGIQTPPIMEASVNHNGNILLSRVEA